MRNVAPHNDKVLLASLAEMLVNGERAVAERLDGFASRLDEYGNVVQAKFAALDERIAARLAEVRDGAPGPAGERGAAGETGPPGAQGERGAQGDAGPPGRPWQHRRAHDPAALYLAGDVVAHDGGSSVALVDNPGDLPGDGWAQLTQRGRAGPPGVKGDRGERGPIGPAGPAGHVPRFELRASADDFSVRIMGDGVEIAACSLWPLFERLEAERAA